MSDFKQTSATVAILIDSLEALNAEIATEANRTGDRVLQCVAEEALCYLKLGYISLVRAATIPRAPTEPAKRKRGKK